MKKEKEKKSKEVKINLFELEKEKLTYSNLGEIIGGRCGACHEPGGNPDPEARLLNNQGTIE